MKKVLIYDDGSGVMVWNVSTPQLKEKGLRSLFKYFDEELNLYCDLHDTGYQRWYKEAKAGDYDRILSLLENRKELFEYEYWYITNVEE
jgi:hypothetical protein